MRKDKYPVHIQDIEATVQLTLSCSLVNAMVINASSTVLSPLANSTNSSQKGLILPDRFGDTTRIIILSLQILVFLVGNVGNVLVCIITSRKRNLRIVGNRFILHLAIADLGILLIVYPLHVLSKELSFSWPLGEFVCKTIVPLSHIFYGVGIGCITAIALHRYRMLVHCMKPQMNAQTAKRVLFLIYLLSFIILVMPLFFVTELQSYPKVGIRICEPRWPNALSQKMYQATGLLAFYICPLCIISLTYIRIRTKLKDNIRKHDSYKRASFKAEDSARKEFASRIGQNRHALKLLAPVVIVFAICMAPLQSTRLVFLFLENPGQAFRRFKHMPNALRIFWLLLSTNSSVNPIIYSVVNTEFRREFIQLLRCDSERCCADTTEGLGFNTFRRSSSVNKSRDNRRSLLLIRRGSSSSRKASSKSSSGNSADKLPRKAGDEQGGGLVQPKEMELVS